MNKNFKFKIRNYSLQSLIFYLIILFLPTQLGKHFWPSFSSVLGIRIDYLSPTVYFTDILIVLLFISFLLRFFKRVNVSSIKHQASNIKLKNVLNFKSKFAICYLLFTVVLVAGVVFAKSPLLGLFGILKFLEFSFFTYYVVLRLKTVKDLGFIALLFFVGIMGESLLATFQFLKQGSLNNFFYFFGERTFTSYTPGIANASLNGKLLLRPYGTFSHPNVLAAYLVIAMTIIVSNFKKNFFFLVLTVGTIGLFLTMSRVAILLWVLIFAVFSLYKFYSIKRKLISKFTIFTIFFLLFTVVFLSPVRYRFSEFNIRDEAVIKRQETMVQSVEVFKKNPFLGTGVNNYLINIRPLFYSNTLYIQPVHNIYLLVLAQTGIFGFSFFIWFIWKTFKQTIYQLKNKSLIQNYKFIILTAALVLGLFDHYFLTLQQGQLLFSLVLGIVWSKMKV